MKVHLRKRKLKPKGNSNKPRHSLYLDIYYRKGRRKREFLGITLEPQDSKELRSEKLKLAEKIKAKRLMELVSESHGFPSKNKQRQEFLSYFEKQTNKRKGNTKMVWINTLNHLKLYSKEKVLFSDIDRDWLDGFVDYLKERVSLQSVSTYFSKVSCSLNEAVKDNILPYNPAKLVDPIRVPQSQREYLTIEEIKRIAQTPFHYEAIKKAFLFSCFTGLRFGDISTLKWSQIKETNFNGNGKSFAIHKRQAKTGMVNHIPLNETALSIIGGSPPKDALVFSLKFHRSYIRKQLYKLLEAAAISKQITFHCARHTFAVMLLANGANLMTVKELMGHKDIKSTQIYAKVVDASKDEAVRSLEKIAISCNL